MPHQHTIHRHQHHYGWDNSLAAAIRIAPGESVEFEVHEASGGQLSKTSTAAAVDQLDFNRINPVTGPVFIDGAERGDVLKVTLLSFTPCGWGWTANIPGFGLLADDFREPALHIWQYDRKTLAPALFGHWGKVPLKPLPAPSVWRQPRPAFTASFRRDVSAATWTYETLHRAPNCSYRSKSQERYFRSVIRMLPRVTVRSAGLP